MLTMNCLPKGEVMRRARSDITASLALKLQRNGQNNAEYIDSLDLRNTDVLDDHFQP